MVEQPRLVTNNEKVIKNIEYFNHELDLYVDGDCDKSITLLLENISHYRAWYAYWDEVENKYLFAPSKYIGYQNIDAKQYAELNRSYLDGRKTEIVLANWYQTLDENDESGTLAKSTQIFEAKRKNNNFLTLSEQNISDIQMAIVHGFVNCSIKNKDDRIEYFSTSPEHPY
ncbi:hypothetical protein [Acinetobacter pollinis]|uniref:hypothetical protein n=1 Tax=Acinetobacter pollinis TaxID=2605270 RepID=UPI0018A2CCAC|nr:hypothetical protein [Acinetobacter pollinis]MBF7691683.1 hypothetical protein [Acinetobacter pollinis]MBF7698701.1 hypothetical protein [Acinetobacter pollinis]